MERRRYMLETVSNGAKNFVFTSSSEKVMRFKIRAKSCAAYSENERAEDQHGPFFFVWELKDKNVFRINGKAYNAEDIKRITVTEKRIEIEFADRAPGFGKVAWCPVTSEELYHNTVSYVFHRSQGCEEICAD